jgi:cytochrome P450
MATDTPTGKCPLSFASTYNREPWDYLEEASRYGSVVWDEELNAWMLFGYDASFSLGRADDTLWRHMMEPGHGDILGMDAETLAEYMITLKTLITATGQPHRAMHRAWVEALSPRVLKDWSESLLEPLVNQQLDKIVERGECEVVEDYADPIAAMVSFAVLGLPSDEDFIDEALELVSAREHVFAQAGVQGADTERIIAEGIAGTRKLYDLILPYAEARRDGTGNDFISLTWRSADRAFDGDYTIDDIVGNAINAFEASAANIASAVSAAFYALTHHDGLQQQVLDGGREALRNFNEEVLRIYSPLPFRPRYAREDIEMGGVTIKKGDAVFALGASANRDETRYPRPTEIDLARRSPRDHWGFAKGPRACPGQSLARAEMEAGVGFAIERLGNIAADTTKPEPEYTGMLLRRWAPMHITFTPGPVRSETAT